MNRAKYITTLGLLLLSLLVPSLAFAASSISENQVRINVDYDKLIRDNQDYISVETESFTITNYQPQDIVVSITATNLPSGYHPIEKQVNVPANGVPAITTLTIEVPHKKKAGEEKIGTIVIKDSNNVQLDSADLIQNTANMLELNQLEVKYTDYNSKTQKEEFKDQETATYTLEEEVSPYTLVTLNFNLRNIFDDDYEHEGLLENVEIIIDSDDNSLFQELLQEEYIVSDIDAGRDVDYSIPFMIDMEVGSDKFNLEITIKAEDGNGVQYKIEKNLELEIQFGNNDVRLVKADITPSPVTLCDAAFSLDAEIHNFGAEYEDHAAISIVNEELGINANVRDIKLQPQNKEQNSWKKIFNFDLDSPKVKTYYLDVTTYVNNDQARDMEQIPLNIVKDCGSQPIVQEETDVEDPLADNNETEIDNDTEAVKSTVGNSAAVKTTESLDYDASDYIMAVLLIAIIAVAVLVILLIAMLFR
ncbi:MAG: hypothetical protein AABX05_04875 [Nanoarchaeota archaeon]